jgi:hypothetical protein
MPQTSPSFSQTCCCDGVYFTMKIANPWTVGGLVFCLSFWVAVGLAGARLADIYAARGPQGFRYALALRLDHRLREIKTLVVHAGRRLA